MNEREMAVMEQYPMEVSRLSRVRGAFLCETKEGWFLLKESSLTEEKLWWENQCLKRLELCGIETDWPVQNREGRFVVVRDDGRHYHVRHYFEGRECDVSGQEDILQMMQCLGRLHLAMREIPEELWLSPKVREIKDGENPNRSGTETGMPEGEAIKQPEDMTMDSPQKEDTDNAALTEPVRQAYMPSEEDKKEAAERVKRMTETFCDHQIEIWERHNREMGRAYTWLRKKKGKTELERMLFQSLPAYKQEGEAAVKQLKELPELPVRLCHGEFNHHHVLYYRGRSRIIDFTHMKPGYQMEDVYQCLRKTMEKWQWDKKLGLELVMAYSRYVPVSRKDYEYLCLRLSYPEKYWKQVNFYFNRNKIWIPGKNLEKLKMIEKQKKQKEEFVRYLKEKLLGFPLYLSK